MKSKIIKRDNDALIKLCKAMTPQERLQAFFNQSRLIYRFYRAGKTSRTRKFPSKARIKK